MLCMIILGIRIDELEVVSMFCINLSSGRLDGGHSR